MGLGELIVVQIEQFIESLYPTEDPKTIAERQSRQMAKEKSSIDNTKSDEAKWDTSRLTLISYCCIH